MTVRPDPNEIVTDQDSDPDLAGALRIGTRVHLHSPLRPGVVLHAVITGYHNPHIYRQLNNPGVRYVVSIDDNDKNDGGFSKARVFSEKFVQPEQYEIEELPV